MFEVHCQKPSKNGYTFKLAVANDYDFVFKIN